MVSDEAAAERIRGPVTLRWDRRARGLEKYWKESDARRRKGSPGRLASRPMMRRLPRLPREECDAC